MTAVPAKDVAELSAEVEQLKAGGRKSINSALKLGLAFIRLDTDGVVRHGQWTELYRQIEISKQRAALFRRLAERFVAAEAGLGKSTVSVLLDGCTSIEEAVRKLPSDKTSTAIRSKTKSKVDSALSASLLHLTARIDKADALNAAAAVVRLLKARGFDASTELQIAIVPRKSASEARRRQWEIEQKQKDEALRTAA